MKKIMIIAAAAALVLSAACTKVEVTSSLNDGDNPIGFSNYVPRSLTKANSANYVESGSALEAHFGVQAWSVPQTSTTPWTNGAKFTGANGTAFMSNVDVTFGGNQAGTEGKLNTYEPLRYWPSGDTPDGLSFFAYYPYSSTTPLTIGANSFTAASTSAAMDDLMVSDVVADQWYGHTNNPNYDGTVDLTFHHVLTKVKFYFKTTVDPSVDPNTEVILTNAQLQAIKTSGTLTVAYDKDAATNKTTYTWDGQGDPDGYNITIDGATPSATNLKLTTSESTCAEGDIFLMVPQAIADNTQKITLTWLVKTFAVGANHSSDAPLSVTTNTKVIDLYDITTDGAAHGASNGITWDQNHQVTYTITVGPKPIYFTATVDEWTTPVEAGQIDVQ